jgi:mRNA interferase MazF
VKAPLQGDIWLARLDPTVGSEIQKTRPCLVVSPDVMNRHLRTVTVLPLTSGSRPTAFRLSMQLNDRDGLLLADQLRTASHLRLIKKVGVAEPAIVSAALAILREMFAEPDGAQ